MHISDENLILDFFDYLMVERGIDILKYEEGAIEKLIERKIKVFTLSDKQLDFAQILLNGFLFHIKVEAFDRSIKKHQEEEKK